MPQDNEGQALNWEGFRRMGWGERLFVTLMVVLPLTAIAAVGSFLYYFLGIAFNLPWWGALPLAIVAAFLIVGGFIANMGNDAMDAIVGSAILLILLVILFPVFHKARETNLRRRKEAIQQQQAQPRQSPPAQPALR